jgi:hypothetical protein
VHQNRPEFRIAVAAAAAALLFTGAARAQSLGPPALAPALPGELGRVTDGVTDRLTDRVDAALPDRLEPRRLLDARDLRLREMVRADPKTLDVDDHGWPVVRDEILALAPTPEALNAAQAAGFRVLRETRLDELDLKVVVLAPPEGKSARKALKRLQALDPNGAYDLDHIYLGAGTTAPVARSAPPAAAASDAGPQVRIGLVDTGVFDTPALAGSKIEQKGFGPGGLAPGAHGTAVASLLAGRAGAFRGAAPDASLYVADVYGRGSAGGAAETVVRGLAWLAGRKTPVINISLVGPPNAALEAAVKALQAQGRLVVAAVGNDGPAAPPLYPAAYPGVIAVTGLDPRGRVLPEAGRGTHVDFAAPGSDMAAAAGESGFATARGTSFAAPLVAGLLARRLAGADRAAAERATEALASEAVDRGARGPDKVYGRGEVGADLRTPPAAVGARGEVGAPR